MDPDTIVSSNGSTPVPPTTTAAPPAAPPPPAPDPDGVQTQTNGKVISMPTSAMAKIKQAERERGKRLAMKEMDDTARSLGYKDMADMKARGKRRPNEAPARTETRPAAPAAATPAPAATKGSRTSDQRVQQMQEERKKALRGRAQTEKRLKQLEHEKLALEAEWELKLAAVKCGVRDVDYAVALIKRATQNMTTEQLDQFDESEYFAKTLRQSHPYLYGEHVVPAHTSTEQTPSDQAPPPPKVEVAKAGENKPGVVDANKLTKEEFDAMLRKQGLGGALSGASPS